MTVRAGAVQKGPDPRHASTVLLTHWPGCPVMCPLQVSGAEFSEGQRSAAGPVLKGLPTWTGSRTAVSDTTRASER